MIDPYYFYMAEQEGLLGTREGRLNSALIHVKERYNRLGHQISEHEFVAILHSNNIDCLAPREMSRFLKYVDFF